MNWRLAKENRDLARAIGDDTEATYWQDILDEVYDYSNLKHEDDYDDPSFEEDLFMEEEYREVEYNDGN